MPGEKVFAAAGELLADYERVDWSRTSLGHVDSWSPALVSALRLVLSTRFPATLLWGPGLALLYNEAYVPLIGQKHPAALGRPGAKVFAEAWPIIQPLMKTVSETGTSIWVANEFVPLHRHGFLEECYFTFSYSPVFNDVDEIEGVLDIATETTSEVIMRRRLAMLSRLRREMLTVERIEDVPRLALTLMREYADDLVAVDIRAHAASGRVHGAADDLPWLPERPSTPVNLFGDLFVESTRQGQVVWLPLETRATAEDPPFLVVRLSQMLAPDHHYLSFLRLIAAAITQSLQRLELLTAERLQASKERIRSEALQVGLLGSPLESDDVRLAVRYRPGSRVEDGGGDWYDSFLTRDGTVNLVIGQTSGRDGSAAGSMAQARTLLRGAAYGARVAPGETLRVLDEALVGLDVEGFATVILARVERVVPDEGVVEHLLRWSNAGRPPPLLLGADGAVRVLDSDPEPMLGLNPRVERHTHSVELPPRSSVLLYTASLLEACGASRADGLTWLVDHVRGQQDLDAEELCDHLLDQLPASSESDIALMVLSLRSDAAEPPDR